MTGTAEQTAKPTTLAFTEEMKGFVTLGEPDFDRGFRQGRQDATSLMFHLTIEVDDIDRFVAEADHRGSAEGWVQCEALGGRRPVERGVFNLFADSADPGRTHMLYRLFFSDAGERPLTLAGFKDVHHDRGFDVWADTTTLFTRVLAGHVGDPSTVAPDAAVASGIITIHLPDFLEQLTTFRAHGPSADAEVRAVSAFGGLFLGKLWALYAERAQAAVERA